MFPRHFCRFSSAHKTREINIEHSTFDAYVIFRDVMYPRHCSGGHKICLTPRPLLSRFAPLPSDRYLSSILSMVINRDYTQHFRAAFLNARWLNLYALIAAIVGAEVSRGSQPSSRLSGCLPPRAAREWSSRNTRRAEFTVLQCCGRENISSLIQGSNEINGGRADFMISPVFFPPLLIPFRYRGQAFISLLRAYRAPVTCGLRSS